MTDEKLIVDSDGMFKARCPLCGELNDCELTNLHPCIKYTNPKVTKFGPISDPVELVTVRYLSDCKCGITISGELDLPKNRFKMG